MFASFKLYSGLIVILYSTFFTDFRYFWYKFALLLLIISQQIVF